jgi:hypothetical protein
MAGLNSNHTDCATTPGRKTYITFDVDEQVAQQPLFAIERERESIVPVYDGSSLASTNVEFVPGDGWRLQSIHSYASNVHENGAPTLDLTVPAGYSSKPTWTQSSQAGASYDASVTANGDPFFSRDFKADGNLTNGDYNLQADQSSLAPAVGSSTNAPMYRVATYPNQGLKELMFSFEVRGNPKSAPDYANAIYFNGPLGWAPNPANNQNTGYYCLAPKGDGRCELLVYLSNGASQVWKLVRSAWFCDPSQVHNHTHRVLITTIPGSIPSVSGGSIVFRFTNSGTQLKNPSQGTYLGVLGRLPGNSGDITNAQFSYVAPGIANNPSEPNYPIRVDTRQDLDVAFQVAVTTYKSSGNLFDGIFQIPFLVDTSKPFTLRFWGRNPSGCNITAQMYAATTDSPPAYTALTITSGSGGDGTQFQPIANARYYCVNFTYTGTTTDTPILQGYRVFRDGVSLTVSPGSFSPAFQQPGAVLRTSCATGPLSITLPDNEPSTASASFMVEDFNGELSRLQKRGDFTITIATDGVDPANPSRKVNRFRGYARLPESEEFGYHPNGWKTGMAETGPNQKFNYGKRFRVQVQCTGMWQRLEEALMPVRWNFGIDNGSPGLPMKVTDAMILLFNFAGFPNTMLDIPNLDIRLFPSSDNDGLVVEPQTSIKELLLRWARDYLGAYFYPEANAGSYGQWVLKQQQTAPYTFRCAFTPASPGPGKVQNSLKSYPAVTLGGQSMPQAPMFKRSVKWNPKPPEANYVISYGVQENGGGPSCGLPSMAIFNMVSFKFAGFPDAANPDPNNPDYMSRPVPIIQYLPSYAYTKDDNWECPPLVFATRRVFDVSCRGRLRKTFIAPEMIIYDADKGYWRELTFYDAVYVNNEPCIVRNVATHEVKDDHQLCAYTVEKIIDGVPVQASKTNGVTSYREALKKNAMRVIGESISNPRHFAAEKRVYGQLASTITLAAKRIKDIQNSDGSFVWCLDYDPLG